MQHIPYNYKRRKVLPCYQSRSLNRLHKTCIRLKKREQIQQLSLRYPDINLDGAYAIQCCWVDMKLTEGRTGMGYKVDLISKAVQYASHSYG